MTPIHPVLTTVVQGFKDQLFVADEVMPSVPVDLNEGKVITFGDDIFDLIQSEHFGTANMRWIDVGYAHGVYSLDEYALEGLLSTKEMEKAAKSDGVQLETVCVSKVTQVLALLKEYKGANIVLNAANYDNDHKVDLATEKWTDDANDPAKDVDVARDAVRSSTGLKPNTLLLSDKAFMAAKRNANVLKVFKRQKAGAVPNESYMKEYFDVEKIVVGSAFYKNDQAGLTDIWGHDAWLGYVAPPKGDRAATSIAKWSRASVIDIFSRGIPVS
uniref:Phage major capsid protein E n=1 Tax=Candidatus Kentrum sp. LPFa TaxID=2126335 RepID=A0A450WDK0_9GAMM|nr:MAG: Phage major capsid protein E [Candidatus Kentron sp. LPFa]VFK30996.1 MAG: Phage major capsid protein E [Candidatus Kentron sp. LPFa]